MPTENESTNSTSTEWYCMKSNSPSRLIKLVIVEPSLTGVVVVDANGIAVIIQMGLMRDPPTCHLNHGVGATAFSDVVTEHDPALTPSFIGAGEIIDEAGDGDIGGSVEVQIVKLIPGTLMEKSWRQGQSGIRMSDYFHMTTTTTQTQPVQTSPP
jgi:hypothetical protein